MCWTRRISVLGQHRPAIDLEAPYQTCLRFLPWCGEDQSTVVNYTCRNPEGQVWWSSSMDSTLWCILACVPLVRCCFGFPLVGEVTKIDLLFAFHVWFCVSSCGLPVPAHTVFQFAVGLSCFISFEANTCFTRLLLYRASLYKERKRTQKLASPVSEEGITNHISALHLTQQIINPYCFPGKSVLVHKQSLPKIYCIYSTYF